MLVYLLLIIIVPVMIYFGYVSLTSFDNKYICVSSVYTITNDRTCMMIMYDYDSIRYDMTCSSGNVTMCKLMQNVKIGDHVVLSGYGYNFDVLNSGKQIKSIKFK